VLYRRKKLTFAISSSDEFLFTQWRFCRRLFGRSRGLLDGSNFRKTFDLEILWRSVASAIYITLLLVLSYHSHPTISPLAQNHWTHRIQFYYKLLSVLPTKFSQLPNFHTFITSWLFNILARSTCSSSVVTLAQSPTSFCLKLTDRSFQYASPVSGINSLYLFNLILVPVPSFPTQVFLHPSLLPLLIHHSAHP